MAHFFGAHLLCAFLRGGAACGGRGCGGGGCIDALTPLRAAGIALINAGIGYWGGGVFCADNAMFGDATKYGMARTSYPLPTSKLASLSFTTFNLSSLTRNASTGLYSGTILTPGGVVPGGSAVMTPNNPFKFTCGNTGDVKDVYGSAQFVGLGFLTFSTISARPAAPPARRPQR